MSGRVVVNSLSPEMAGSQSRSDTGAALPGGATTVTMYPQSLKSRILRAGSWTFFSHIVGQILRLGGSLILTRLLVPEMFGVLAIAMMIQSILSLLSDIGLRQTVIQSGRGESRDLLDTAWTMQVLRGLLIWILCVLAAVVLLFAGNLGFLPANSAIAAPELPWVTAGLALSAIVTGLQSTKLMSTNRELDMRWGVSIELMAQVAGLVVAIGLAWWTRSVWSFVVSSAISAAVFVALSHWWLPGPNNRLRWDVSSVREIINYGRWVLTSSLLSVLSTSGDRMLLGVWYDAATLGVYGVALTLATAVDVAGGRLFSAVAMPAFSEVARTDRFRLRSVYFRMRLPFDLGFLMTAGILFATGPAIVQWLYDSRYERAGEMLQWLSCALFFARYGMTTNAYLALGEPHVLTWTSAVKTVSFFVLTPLLHVGFGWEGALIAIAFHAAPSLLVLYWFNRRHGLNNMKFELKVLPAWLVGYGVGRLAIIVAG